MARFHTTAWSPESVSPVEFDTDSESFRATYDSSRDSPSLAVVAVVAAALGREPNRLTPLQTVVETDALDTLATESASGPGGCASISFEYHGFDVTVAGGGVIEATPIT